MTSREPLKFRPKKEASSSRKGLLALVEQMAELKLPISSTKRMKEQSIAPPKPPSTPSTTAP